MSIKDTGYLDFFGKKCIFVQDEMDYVLLPVDENANILCYSFEKNYTLNFSTAIDKKCIASVQEQVSSGINGVRLRLNYIAKCISDEAIDGFIMTGNEVDEFFSPLEHYYWLKRKDQYSPTDLLYSKEIIAEYKFNVQGKEINIDLAYGNILSNGIRSDLSMHAKLIVKFQKTNDFDFIKQVQDVIITFLQFVHRKQKYNLNKIELFTKTNSTISCIGYMFSDLYNRDLRPQSRIDASFIYYGDKINNLLSIIASNLNLFPITHLDDCYNNVYSYSFARFSALCSAFEFEYDQSTDYPKNSVLDLKEMKDDIVKFISSKPDTNELIADFKKEATNRIQTLGKKPGLKQKINNAFECNKDSLEKSLSMLFPRVKEIKECAKILSNLRGKVLHNDSGYVFDDKELECIRFLDILQFVMVLRRANYTSNEIEIIIGVLFHCNSEYFKLYE